MPWEMFNFTFMFIKPLCHKSCFVYWCIILQGIVFEPLGEHGPLEWFRSQCCDIAAQTIGVPPLCFTLAMQQSE